MHSLRQRLARDEGFTLIELLVVLIIIGVLLAIAIPSYLGFQKKAQQTAAMSDGGLQTTYDSGLQVVGVNGATQGISKAVVGSGGAQTYCISGVVSGHWAFVKGPGGQVQNGDNTNPVTAADPC
jgi:prepilin-type N-terminal cleavage/methylation domain-containing protein